MPVSFVPMEAVSQVTGEITSPQTKPLSTVFKGYTRFREDDLLWAKITPCMQNGKSAIAPRLENDLGFGSTEFHVIRANPELLLPRFVWLILRLKTVLKAAQRYFIGSAGQQRVPEDFLEGLFIPVPPKEIQQYIVDRALKAESEIEAKRKDLNQNFETARMEVENRILGRLETSI